MVLPLPTSPCSRRFIGLGRAISSAISFSTRFCALVGLNGSSFLICSRTRSVSCELDARQRARLLPLDLEPAFQPEELFEDQPELRGRTEVVQDPDRRAGGGKVRLANGFGARGEPQMRADRFRADGLRAAGISCRMRCISTRSTRVLTLPAAS